jgi:hypothetical protein
MRDWQPYREPLRLTLTRTFTIALLAGAITAPWFGGIRRWPIVSLLMLWPSLGGHWIDVLFLNALRPRLPHLRLVQAGARLAVWFLGGIVLALGLRLTAVLLRAHAPLLWLTWAIAGIGFVAIELIAHAALQVRGRPSFYNGLG